MDRFGKIEYAMELEVQVYLVLWHCALLHVIHIVFFTNWRSVSSKSIRSVFPVAFAHFIVSMLHLDNFRNISNFFIISIFVIVFVLMICNQGVRLAESSNHSSHF